MFRKRDKRKQPCVLYQGNFKASMKCYPKLPERDFLGVNIWVSETPFTHLD